jgi:hypothetical protein
MLNKINRQSLEELLIGFFCFLYSSKIIGDYDKLVKKQLSSPEQWRCYAGTGSSEGALGVSGVTDLPENTFTTGGVTGETGDRMPSHTLY